MTFYRHILVQALKTTWHYKYLWFFGLFAALIGNGGELEILFRGYRGTTAPGLFPAFEGLGGTGLFSKNIFANIINLSRTDPFSLFISLGVLLVIIVLSLFLVWLAVTSQAALVNNTAQAKTDRKHDFKKGMEAGIKYFWPVFSLNLMLRAILYVSFILLSLPIIGSLGGSELDSRGILFFLSFLIFLPLGIVISFIAKYAIAYVVIKGEKLINALRLSWKLFTGNWLISIEMAFILFFINFIVGLGLVLFLLVLTVPFIFIAVILSKLAFYINFYIIIVSAMIFYIGFIAIIGAMLSSFQISSWTGLFIELISKGGISKMTRLFAKE